MTAQEVLSYLLRQGIELWIEGDKLRYRGMKRTLPPSLVVLLRRHKTQLMALIRERAKSPIAPFPLSYTQKAFWFLYQLNPTSGAYITSSTISLHGSVSLPALLQAYLTEQLSRILRIPAPKLALQSALTSLGMDSLMALELRNQLSADLQIAVPIPMLLEGAAVKDLATYILTQMTERSRMDSGAGALEEGDI